MSTKAILTLLVSAALAGFVSPAWAGLQVSDLTGSAVANVGPYYKDVNDAIQAFSMRDYGTALGLLQRAKKTTPQLAPAEVMMAQLYFDSQQAANGVGMLEQAIRNAPQDPEAYVALAERAVLENRYTEATMMSERAEKLVEALNENPRRKQKLQSRLYATGATAAEARGDLETAKTRFDALVQAEPANALAHERYARVLFALKDQKGAYEQFKLVAENDKKSMPPELMMAMISSDKATAEKWLGFALKKSPDDARTQSGIVTFMLKTNQLDKAKQHAAQAVKLDPEGLDSNLGAGLVAQLTGDYATAERHLSKAHLLAPTNAMITDALALVLLEKADDESHQRALQYAEMNVRQNPNSTPCLATFGWINYRLNHKDDAERAFSAVLNSKDSQSVSSDMAYYLATLAASRGSVQEATRLLRGALGVERSFMYRKSAEALLAELDKSGGAVKPAGQGGKAETKTDSAKDAKK